mmetsp:Transcript_38638/g.93617  ORF Transcript_38638/g.93617 Transcript_38638/m.93617 type:complete len:744 (-) Transcript_38638:316-2547(-)
MSFLFSNSRNSSSSSDNNKDGILKKKKRSSSYRPLQTTDEVFVGDEEPRNDKEDDNTAEEESTKVVVGVAFETSSVDPRQRNVSSTIGRLIEMARPERHLMILAGISMTLGSGVSLAVPFFCGRIIDLSLGHHNNDNGDDDDTSPFRLLINLVIIMTLSGMIGFFRMLWQAQAGHRLVARIRRQLYRSILSQDAAYFDSTPQGDLISRLSSDADLVQSAVTDMALGILRNVVVAIGAIALLLYTSVKLSFVSIAILPPVAFAARYFGRNMKDRQKRVRELHADATSLAEQALTCIRTVQQFATEQFESDLYSKAINEAHAEGIANMKLKAMFGSVMQLVVNLVMVVVLGYGGRLVQAGDMTPGDLTSFVMYSVMMGGNISSISTQYIDLMKAVAAANRVFDIVDRTPAIPPPIIVESANDEKLIAPAKANKVVNHQDISLEQYTDMENGGNNEVDNNNKDSHVEMSKMTIEETNEQRSSHNDQDVSPLSVQFTGVDFSYPTRPETKVLDKLNLTIPAGKMLALVGGSGAGKSTIASLLTRLYDPKSGTIWLGDDQRLRDIHPQEVRRKVGIVAQEPLLFSTTILENIRYGSPDASNDAVLEAARLAYVLEFAADFPDGLETVVGTRGTQLSGGQKQRVAIARLILKNPPIVILDESTSALDAESEFQVQEAIDIACKGRTVILIAHRMSTIRSADTVAVLMNGQVAEMGSFEELMDESRDNDKLGATGSFRRLMEKQLLSNTT